MAGINPLPIVITQTTKATTMNVEFPNALGFVNVLTPVNVRSFHFTSTDFTEDYLEIFIDGVLVATLMLNKNFKP